MRSRYNGETVGSGSIVNEVLFEFNDFAQLTHDYQAHGGAVNTSTTPKVQYGYADGSSNTIRPTTITYPNGRVITLDYGTTGGIHDAASRVAALVDDDASSTHLADYCYLGLSTFVEVDYTEPDIKWTMVGTAGGTDPDTGDIYRGFDRFGRIKDNYWYDYGSSVDVDRIKYGYDRNGNRTYRENTVAASLSKYFDELYDYDLIDRLATMDRGELDNLKSQIQNLQFAQDWALDATGNWSGFKEDDDGSGAWDLDQLRTANKVNEITDITESTGPSWVTPVYSKAGNMTTIPQPADPTKSFAGTYDAWNRLVRLLDGSDIVAEYQYDGAKRRTVKKTYTGGVLDETRHLYYTEPSKWQVVEERIDNSTDPERQFVWGLRYVDDLVLRGRDTSADGSFDERLYGIQDANWSPTAIADEVGTIHERYSYASYGASSVFTPAFGFRPNSSYDWKTRFAGYKLDSSGLYQVRNRSYIPGLGWGQRDLAHRKDGLNLYEYCLSNPVTLLDFSGLYAVAVGNQNPVFLGKDVCSVLLSDCFGNGMSCFCGVADWAGFIPGPVTSTLNCLCELWDLLLAYCQCSPAPAIVHTVFGLADCALGFVTHVWGVVASIFADILETVIDALFYVGGEPVPPDLVSCGLIVKDCLNL